MSPAAAWLLLDSPSGRHLSLPVPRRALGGLTRAVSFVLRRMAVDRDAALAQEVEDRADWEEVCWQACATDPALAIWMVAESRRQAVEAAQAGQADGESSLHRWLERLRNALVLPLSPQPLGRLGAAATVPETWWHELVGGGLTDQPPRLIAAELARQWWECLDECPATEHADPSAARFPPDGADDEQVLILDSLFLAAGAVGRLLAGYDSRVAAARLEAIRELAYGAGHEINNPLANIAARGQALLLDETDPERRRRLATIVDQAFRGRDMIGGLMIFARPPRPSPTSVDIAAVLEPLTQSLQATAAERGVRLAFNPPQTPIIVRIDRGQIEESLRGILLNAIEAISGGGTVTIKAAVSEDPTTPGCLVSIVDNGIGMNRETVERIFDPFFSGREAGRGVGLGLSKALRLIEGNDGKLTVKSRPRQGTTVSVGIPLATRP